MNVSHMKRLSLGAASLAFCALSFAQAPGIPTEREKGSAGIFSCDRLGGAERELCLSDERRREERAALGGGAPRGSCDVFIGPERERCLQQGGTIEAGGGASAPRQPETKR